MVTDERAPEEMAAVREAIKTLANIHQENKKMSDEQKAAAKQKAQADFAQWTAGHPNADTNARNEKWYEFSCRAGGAALNTALRQIEYMLTGRGIVHMVTIFSHDLGVNRPKQDPAPARDARHAGHRRAAAPPQLFGLMQKRVQQLADWRAADLAAAEAAAKEKADADEAEKRAEEWRRRAADDALHKDMEKKAKAALMSRMLNRGCKPKFVKGGVIVEFVSLPVSGSKHKEGTVEKRNQADAQRELRAGTFKLTKGRAAGKYLIFAGDDPTKGHLYGTTCMGVTPTEICATGDIDLDAVVCSLLGSHLHAHAVFVKLVRLGRVEQALLDCDHLLVAIFPRIEVEEREAELVQHDRGLGDLFCSTGQARVG